MFWLLRQQKHRELPIPVEWGVPLHFVRLSPSSRPHFRSAKNPNLFSLLRPWSPLLWARRSAEKRLVFSLPRVGNSIGPPQGSAFPRFVAFRETFLPLFLRKVVKPMGFHPLTPRQSSRRADISPFDEGRFQSTLLIKGLIKSASLSSAHQV